MLERRKSANTTHAPVYMSGVPRVRHGVRRIGLERPRVKSKENRRYTRDCARDASTRTWTPRRPTSRDFLSTLITAHGPGAHAPRLPFAWPCAFWDFLDSASCSRRPGNVWSSVMKAFYIIRFWTGNMQLPVRLSRAYYWGAARRKRRPLCDATPSIRRTSDPTHGHGLDER